MTNHPHYVDLRAALRVVAEALPGGKALAAQLTDELIKRGVGLFAPEGSDLLKLYRAAVPLLANAIKSPTVELLVVAESRDGELPEEQRPIHKDERDYRLEIREALLAPPFGQSPSVLAALLHVLVSAEDLRREVADMLDPPRYGSNAMKQRAIDEQIERYGPQKLDDMGPEEAARTIRNRVKDAHDGLTVSSAMIRGRITARKARSPVKPMTSSEKPTRSIS